jgi:type I restriction enzyme, S subunit
LIICTASGSKSHLGKVAYIDDDYGYAFGGFMGMLTPKNELNSKFLFHLMTSPAYKDFIAALSDGTNINNLKFDDLKQFVIPVPPLPEQQRIVTLLDDAFDSISIAKTNAERSLQNARAIFESHLQSVFAGSGEDWIDTVIGKCIRFIDYRGKTPVKTTGGLKLITAKNVRMGYLKNSPEEFVAPESYDKWMTRGIPKCGDVLFTTEAPLANVAQLDTDEKVVFAQRIIVMQADATKLDSSFLKYMLISAPVQQRIREKGTGATVQGIKASLLKLIEISFPASVEEQRRIVAQLDEVSQETQRLESIYQQKLSAVDELKKSLLHQAFHGSL